MLWVCLRDHHCSEAAGLRPSAWLEDGSRQADRTLALFHLCMRVCSSNFEGRLWRTFIATLASCVTQYNGTHDTCVAMVTHLEKVFVIAPLLDWSRRPSFVPIRGRPLLSSTSWARGQRDVDTFLPHPAHQRQWVMPSAGSGWLRMAMLGTHKQHILIALAAAQELSPFCDSWHQAVRLHEAEPHTIKHGFLCCNSPYTEVAGSTGYSVPWLYLTRKSHQNCVWCSAAPAH